MRRYVTAFPTTSASADTVASPSRLFAAPQQVAGGRGGRPAHEGQERGIARSPPGGGVPLEDEGHHRRPEGERCGEEKAAHGTVGGPLYVTPGAAPRIVDAGRGGSGTPAPLPGMSSIHPAGSGPRVSTPERVLVHVIDALPPSGRTVESLRDRAGGYRPSRSGGGAPGRGRTSAARGARSARRRRAPRRGRRSSAPGAGGGGEGRTAADDGGCARRGRPREDRLPLLPETLLHLGLLPPELLPSRSIASEVYCSDWPAEARAFSARPSGTRSPCAPGGVPSGDPPSREQRRPAARRISARTPPSSPPSGAPRRPRPSRRREAAGAGPAAARRAATSSRCSSARSLSNPAATSAIFFVDLPGAPAVRARHPP